MRYLANTSPIFIHSLSYDLSLSVSFACACIFFFFFIDFSINFYACAVVALFHGLRICFFTTLFLSAENAKYSYGAVS